MVLALKIVFEVCPGKGGVIGIITNIVVIVFIIASFDTEEDVTMSDVRCNSTNPVNIDRARGGCWSNWRREDTSWKVAMPLDMMLSSNTMPQKDATMSGEPWAPTNPVITPTGDLVETGQMAEGGGRYVAADWWVCEALGVRISMWKYVGSILWVIYWEHHADAHSCLMVCLFLALMASMLCLVLDESSNNSTVDIVLSTMLNEILSHWWWEHHRLLVTASMWMEYNLMQ